MKLTLITAVILTSAALLLPTSTHAAAYRIETPGDTVDHYCTLDNTSDCTYQSLVVFANNTSQSLYDTTLYKSGSGIEFTGFNGNWTSGQSTTSQVIAPDQAVSTQVRFTPTQLTVGTHYATLYIDGKTCNQNTNPPDCYFYGGKSLNIRVHINPAPTNTPAPTPEPTSTPFPTPTQSPTTPTPTTQPSPTPTNTIGIPTPTSVPTSTNNQQSKTTTKNTDAQKSKPAEESSITDPSPTPKPNTGFINTLAKQINLIPNNSDKAQADPNEPSQPAYTNPQPTYSTPPTDQKFKIHPLLITFLKAYLPFLWLIQ
jgi:hypothetical protein